MGMAALTAQTARSLLRANWAERPAAVFCYHGVEDDSYEPASMAGEGRYLLSISQVKDHLQFLASERFRVISLDLFVRGVAVEAPRRVVLTFDDGRASDRSVVLPMLIERGFSATFFIVADWVNRPGCIRVPELLEMRRCGMHIGSHGLTHSRLDALPLPALDRELRESKEQLEDMVGCEVAHLAIPGGFMTPLVLERANAAGYRHVCTSVPGLARPDFIIRRLSVTRVTTLPTFSRLAKGDHRQLFQRQALYTVRQAIKRTIGVPNYEKLCGLALSGLRRQRPGASQTVGGAE